VGQAQSQGFHIRQVFEIQGVSVTLEVYNLVTTILGHSNSKLGSTGMACKAIWRSFNNKAICVDQGFQGKLGGNEFLMGQ